MFSSSLATQRLWELQLWVNTQNNALGVRVHAEPDWLVCGPTASRTGRSAAPRRLSMTGRSCTDYGNGGRLADSRGSFYARLVLEMTGCHRLTAQPEAPRGPTGGQTDLLRQPGRVWKNGEDGGDTVLMLTGCKQLGGLRLLAR